MRWSPRPAAYGTEGYRFDSCWVYCPAKSYVELISPPLALVAENSLLPRPFSGHFLHSSAIDFCHHIARVAPVCLIPRGTDDHIDRLMTRPSVPDDRDRTRQLRTTRPSL
jgi:hypothetical protein